MKFKITHAVAFFDDFFSLKNILLTRVCVEKLLGLGYGGNDCFASAFDHFFNFYDDCSSHEMFTYFLHFFLYSFLLSDCFLKKKLCVSKKCMLGGKNRHWVWQESFRLFFLMRAKQVGSLHQHNFQYHVSVYFCKLN